MKHPQRTQATLDNLLCRKILSLLFFFSRDFSFKYFFLYFAHPPPPHTHLCMTFANILLYDYIHGFQSS